MDLDKGGRGAIERMVEAYGFTTRQALCDKLGVSKSTLATRYMRDSFPADWVIQCALETGASLRWLVSGTGVTFENLRTDIIEIPKIKIIEGKFFDAGFLIFDKALIKNHTGTTVAIVDNGNTFLADNRFNNIEDGLWLITIDGFSNIRSVIRTPGNKVRIQAGDTSFDCLISEVNFVANIYLKVESL